jgi:hypothetical protein
MSVGTNLPSAKPPCRSEARLNNSQNRSNVRALLHQRHRGGRKVDADGCFDMRSYSRLAEHPNVATGI